MSTHQNAHGSFQNITMDVFFFKILPIYLFGFHKMLTFLMLARLATLCPAAVVQRLDRLVEPLRATCTTKVRLTSSRQLQHLSHRVLVAGLFALRKRHPFLPSHGTGLGATTTCLDHFSDVNFKGYSKVNYKNTLIFTIIVSVLVKKSVTSLIPR